MQKAVEEPIILTLYRENQVNGWKFLESMDTDTGREAGLFVRSPVPILTLTSMYILFVVVIGPRIMRNREPFKLKNLIRFYNLLEVFLAAILLSRLYKAVETMGNMFSCTKTFNFHDSSAVQIYDIANFILMVRLSEYLDTIFFTLRKKHNQVTFLHVFHHAFVPMYAYWILRTAPVRFNLFIIMINSAIHVLMYFYYFLATFQQPREPSGSTKRPPKQSLIMSIVSKVLMFKKYVTQLQIVQFIALALYAIWASLQKDMCGVPGTYIVANLLLAFGFLGLFVHFYMRAYRVSATSGSRTKRD